MGRTIQYAVSMSLSQHMKNFARLGDILYHPQPYPLCREYVTFLLYAEGRPLSPKPVPVCTTGCLRHSNQFQYAVSMSLSHITSKSVNDRGVGWGVEEGENPGGSLSCKVDPVCRENVLALQCMDGVCVCSLADTCTCIQRGLIID